MDFLSSTKSQLLLVLVMLLLHTQLVVLSCAESSSDDDGNAAAAQLLPTATIAGIHRGLVKHQFTCRQLIAEQLRRIDEFNGKLHAVISVIRSSALAEAAAKDKAGGIKGSLHCVPVMVKDNIDVKGVPTTNGAEPMRRMVPMKDNVMVQRIRAAGGIIIGKSNMAEMSDSGTSSNSTVGGLCANPWDVKRSCLGSSGGSGASVAAGLSVIGLGTDTEGSVIGPCVAAGLVCVRPSNTKMFQDAMVGVYPAFSKQDALGIMARNVDDFIAVYDAVYGTKVQQSAANAKNLTGVTVRFLRNFLESFPIGAGLNYKPNTELVELHNRTADRMASLGAKIDDYKLPLAELGQKLMQIVTATMAKPPCSKSCMKRDVDNYFKSYGPNATFHSASDLWKARKGFPVLYQQKLNYTLHQAAADVCSDAGICKAYLQARSAVSQVLQELKGNATVVAMPFTAQLPQRNGEEPGFGDQISPALNPYTGWPSLAMPVGFASSGDDSGNKLPVGMVLMANRGQEQLLLNVAKAYLAKYHVMRSPASAPALNDE